MKRHITVMLAIVLCMSVFVGCDLSYLTGSSTPSPEGARHVFSLAEARAYNWITHAEVEAIAAIHNATIEPATQALASSAVTTLEQGTVTAWQKNRITREWKTLKEAEDYPMVEEFEYYRCVANYARIRHFEVCFLEPVLKKTSSGGPIKTVPDVIDGVSFNYNGQWKGTEIVLWTEDALVNLERKGLASAYQNGWLTYQDLITLAYMNYNAQRAPQDLNKTVVRSIGEKEAGWVRDEEFEVDRDEVKVTHYYGCFENCYVVFVDIPHTGIADGMPSDNVWELDGIRFRYHMIYARVYRVPPVQIEYDIICGMAGEIEFITESSGSWSDHSSLIIELIMDDEMERKAFSRIHADWIIDPRDNYDEEYYKEKALIVYVEKMPYHAQQYWISGIRATSNLIEVIVSDKKTNVTADDPSDLYFAMMIEIDKKELGAVTRVARLIE